MNDNVATKRQLRVHLSAALPIDPLRMKTMATYDLSLMLWRSWFEYDKGRRAEHGLIKSWTYDPKEGRYTFVIDEVRWSDGSRLTAQQLIQNIHRIATSRTPYAKSLLSTVDLNSLTESLDKKALSFKTKNSLPAHSLFNQLASVFFSVVHPRDFGDDGSPLKSNTLFLGPYKPNQIEPDLTVFKANDQYKKSNSRGPIEVLVKPPNPEFTIEKFLEQRTWANYYQTNTFLATTIAERLKNSHFPIWTRGYDRVALIRPLGFGQKLKANRSAVLRLAAQLSLEKKIEHPLQVAVARSLQPLGYPLFQELKSPAINSEGRIAKSKKVRILTYQLPQLDLIRPWLTEIAAKALLKFDWHIVQQSEFVEMDWDTSGDDLVLFSFGVADPEPTTWLSMVMGSKFISYDSTHLNHFHKLIAEENSAVQVTGYRDLLSSIAKIGGYLPLLHGATISVGTPNMSFKKIDPLDETVDYSKIEFTE